MIYGLKFLALFHSLSNIEIVKYFKFKTSFNGIFQRNTLAGIKDGVYVINLDDKKSKGTH